MDSRRYYDPPSDYDSDDSLTLPPYELSSNSQNKLVFSARWARKGKAYAWGPTHEATRSEQRMRKRFKLCLETVMPDAAMDIGLVPAPNIADAGERRAAKRRKKDEVNEYVLSHLRSPEPPASTMKLAPMLALPRGYVDIMSSPSMRHSLGDDTVVNGLQKTAGELLEGDLSLVQAMGRFREVIRARTRDLPSERIRELPQARPAGSDPNAPEASVSAEETAAKTVPPLPHVSDTDNLWRITQELLVDRSVSYTATPADAITSRNLHSEHVKLPTWRSAVHKLFTCPTGLTLNGVPNANHAGRHLPRDHKDYPKTVEYNLDMATQCDAVNDAMERIAELLADCREYRERLEEARARVGDISRVRKLVWGVIKERAAKELDAGGY